MPYGNNSYSPSLRKNETARYSRASTRRRLSLGRLLGDPFALATISIAILAWLIEFIAGIIATIEEDKNRPYPNFAWWTTAYTLCCIVGVICMVAGDAIYTYHVAAVGFLATGLFLTTSSVNATIYSDKAAEEAAGAGYILLSIVLIVWIFYFGSQPQATPRIFIDSFALHKSNEERPSPRDSRRVQSRSYDNGGNSYLQTSGSRQQHNSSHLPGFETSSPVMNQSTSNNTNSINAYERNSQYQPMVSDMRNGPTTYGGLSAQQPSTSYTQETSSVEVPPPTDYPFKAKALYAYEANAEDPNEISFAKNEMLEVSDVSGRWWQARKANGETGIAPSNYLLLAD